MSTFNRFANLFRRTRVDREIDAELQSHIALRIDDNLAHGMSPEDARRDALLRFGNPTSTKEHVTAVDASLSIEALARDIPYAVRQLRRSPGSTVTAILTPISASSRPIHIRYSVGNTLPGAPVGPSAPPPDTMVLR